MNWMQTINTLIFVFGVFFGVLAAIHLANVWKQRLPEKTCPRYEQFARMAVQQVEQQSSNLSGSAKKQLASASMTKLAHAYDLPAPPPDAIDIALESAVYECIVKKQKD